MANRVFGNGAVYDGGYVYTYASQPRTCAFCFASDMYVARVPESQMHGAERVAVLVGIAVGRRSATRPGPCLPAAVSNTDVQRYGNGFLLVTKTFSIIGPPVEAWWSPNPVGPVDDLGTVFSVPTRRRRTSAGSRYSQSYTYNPVVLAARPTRRRRVPRVVRRQHLRSRPTRSATGCMLGSALRLDARCRRRRTRRPRPTVAVRAPSPWAPTFGVDRAGRVSTVDGGVGVRPGR